MGASFWIKRYLLAAIPLFAILAAVEWFKGSNRTIDYLSAGAWAVIAAGIFTFAGWRRLRNTQACKLCDTFDAAAGKDSKAP